MFKTIAGIILSFIAFWVTQDRKPASIPNSPAQDCEGHNCRTGTCWLSAFWTVTCRLDPDLTVSCFTSGIKNSDNEDFTSACEDDRCTYNYPAL